MLAKLIYTLCVIVSILQTVSSQDCNQDPNAGTKRCDGMKCKFDWQCASEYCYSDSKVGKDTCSKVNNCATTIFSHYGRCDGVECETSSNCINLGCVNQKCKDTKCYGSASYISNRCDGVSCSVNSHCQSGNCFESFCSSKTDCSSNVLSNANRCEGSICTLNKECKNNACVGGTCSFK